MRFHETQKAAESSNFGVVVFVAVVTVVVAVVVDTVAVFIF